jgi:hypothetical protein
MWYVKDRDGHCEVGKGQRPNPLQQDDDNDENGDFTKRDDIASNLYFEYAQI